MNPPRIILSTCGTSILNFGQPADVRKWLLDIANKKVLARQDQLRLNEITALQRESLAKIAKPELHRASAELSCVDLLLTRHPTDRVQHILVHTDTCVGQASAQLVREISLTGAELITVDGLRTDQTDVFREALSRLTDYLERRLTGSEHSIIFNLAGGFKSMSAYLQALGMLHADLCVFLFEGATELMEIPRLPLKLMDADELRPYLTVFRKLDAGYPISTAEAAGIPEALLLILDGLVARSVWGDVFWNRLKGELLSWELLPPLSPRMRYKATLHREFDSAPQERRDNINESLDALSAHLDLGLPILKSKTFKTLKGSVKSPSTHELYLFNDYGAYRMWGHFERNPPAADLFLCDSLGPHL